MPRKLTLLYQNPATPLREWYTEILGPLVDQVIDDGTHTVVMDDCIVSDSFVRLHDPTYYRRFRDKNAFLLLSPDEYYATPVEVYNNFCGVIRSHYADAFLGDRVKQIPVGYLPGSRVEGECRIATQRKYVWSFLGEVNKTTRPECVRSLIRITPNLWHATDGWKPNRTKSLPNTTRSSAEYYSVLRESAFVPCPMGNVSQEAHRIYEALEVGAIPILERRLTMDAHRKVLGSHPIPTFYRWSDAAAYVVKMWQSPAELDQLQVRCISWWTEYKLQLSRDIGAFLSRLEDQFPTAQTQYIAPYARIPGWSLFELSRHHTWRALLRRVRRHTRRLLTTGRLIVHK